MGVGDVTAEAVLRAVAECRELGVEAFVDKYGFGSSRDVLLDHEGDLLPSKAILGVAHKFAVPEQGPLPSDAFTGGEQTIRKLEELGFTVRRLSAGGDLAPPNTWVVRAGAHDESLELALDEGWCGIGWPQLGDLSVLSEEGLKHEIDMAYGDQSNARIGQYKAIVGSFMQIRQGDIVLTPIKGQGQVAVGVIVGDYEYRPDNPETAHHIRAVDWIDKSVRRELLGDLLRWIDRPPAVSRIPVEDAEALIRKAIADEVPVWLPKPATEGALRQLLISALAAVAAGRGDEVRRLIDHDAPTIVRSVIGDERAVSTGTGVATPAQVPWIGVHPKGAVASAQQGYYLVYLFAADGSACYLSLNQGTEKVKGGMKPLVKRAMDLRAAAGIEGPGEAIDLASEGARPLKYQAGSAHSIEYPHDGVPDEDDLRGDLSGMLELLDNAQASGLELDPEIEPLHLLFKWSSDVEPQTLELHRAMLEERDATWWSKIGGAGIDSRKLALIQEQLDREIPTYAFLYGGGQLVRARLQQLTDDPAEVDDARRPPYAAKEDCSLFALIDGFETLEPGWPLDHLVLASDPDPMKVHGALGNRTALLFMYERFAPTTADATPPPTTALTRFQLEDETPWTSEQLDEVLAALDPGSGKGQVILAGPPGTGKTWVAELLSRYLTQDQPLQRRIVQLHPSYGYEEFVEGLRPVTKGGAISFERRDGVILQMAKAMDGTGAPHVLVIDEINRANIPRVFGELLYLLEYRGQSIDLQYSEQFSLPRNLRIIATMNTADRSIRSIDVALRRRFEVFECSADPDILSRYYQRKGNASSVDGLIEGFSRLNTDLTELLDRHHAIGQSFFMGSAYSHETLRRTWQRQIYPLIEDYFFDQPDIAVDFTLEKYWPGL